MKYPIYYLIICVSLCILRVHTLALKGPAVTRYDPCGLALIHFNKLTRSDWQAILNLGVYNNITEELEIEISFDKRITLYGVSFWTYNTTKHRLYNARLNYHS